MDNKILTAEQELKLRKPIDDRVGAIQKEIDDLRADGTNKVLFIQNEIDSVKRDRIYTKAEKDAKIAKYQAELEQARAVEAGNKDKIAKLISQAEEFLNANYDKDYFQPVKESCEREKRWPKRNTPEKCRDWKKSTKKPWQSFLTTVKSKTRSMCIRTVCLRLRWSLKKIFSR